MSVVERALFTRGVTLLLVSITGVFVQFALLLPLVPAWAERHGASSAAVGSTTTVMMSVTVLAQVGMPWVMRRFGAVTPYAVGVALMGLPTIALPWVSAIEGILAIQAIRGLGFASVVVAGSALAATLTDPRLRGRSVAAYGAAIGAAQIPTLAGGLPLVEAFGWSVVFLGGALAALLVLPAAWLIPDSVPRRGDPAPATRDNPHLPGVEGSVDVAPTARPAPTPGSWGTPAVVLLAASLAYGAIGTFLGLTLELGWAVFAALFLASTGQVAGRWWAGVVSDRRGAGVLLTPMVASSAVGVTLVTVALLGEGPGGVLTSGPLSGVWSPLTHDAVAILGAALFGLGFGALQNDTFVVMVERAGPEHIGMSSTVWNMGFDGGTGFGALVVGALAAGIGIPGGFAVLAAAIVATLPFAVAIAATERRSRASRRESRQTR